MLIHEGLNIYHISKRLGHSSINVTLKDYGHLLKETYEQDNKKALKVIENLWHYLWHKNNAYMCLNE